MTVKFKPRKVTNRIILHDSHTTPDLENPDKWLQWTGRKMGLLETGYHFIVDRHGVIIESRDRATIGTHTPGHNLDSIGIVLIGGRGLTTNLDEPHAYPEDNFTEAQRIGLFELITILKREFPGIAIFGHSEVQRYVDRNMPKCPYLDMDDLRADYLTYVQSGGLVV